VGGDEVEFDGVLFVEFPVELPPWVGVLGEGVKVTGIAVVKVKGTRFGPKEIPTENEVETTTEAAGDDEALLL
jgi:hypothetical protein